MKCLRQFEGCSLGGRLGNQDMNKYSVPSAVDEIKNICKIWCTRRLAEVDQGLGDPGNKELQPAAEPFMLSKVPCN